MVTPELQVHVPAGMITVSPLAAELMALCTSFWKQDPAVCVCAIDARPERALKGKANSSQINILDGRVIGSVPLKLAQITGSQSQDSSARSTQRGTVYRTTELVSPRPSRPKLVLLSCWRFLSDFEVRVCEGISNDRRIQFGMFKPGEIAGRNSEMQDSRRVLDVGKN